MNNLSTTITKALASEYQMRAAELHNWVDPLSEEQFWTNPFEYGNSVGHLVLHLTGNLSYYLGAQIAATGYVRNRDLEFTDGRLLSKKEVLKGFDDIVALVVRTIEVQSEDDWVKSYTAEREPEAKDRFTVFLRCVVHLYHHIGQINYLGRELMKQKV